jgi:excisionase family DNA binding protein
MRELADLATPGRVQAAGTRTIDRSLDAHSQGRTVRGDKMTEIKAPAADRQLYRVTDVMRMLSMSRSVIYEQLRSGRLRSVRQGRSRRIPAAAIAEYVALLEREAEQ